MTDNEKCIHAFYSAFKNRDADTMGQYYADDIVFNDPAFGTLNGKEAKAMWKMLCSTGKDLKINFKITHSENDLVKAHWIADYTFSKTGRKVHNEIDAIFTLKDKLIIEHRDSFNLHKWASQALGWKGRLIGGTSYFQKKLNSQTKKLLSRFMSTSN